jgi:hypothetical protein
MKTSTTHSILAVLLTFVLANPSSSMVCDCIVSGETKSATIEFAGETHCYVLRGEVGQGIVIHMADDDAAWSPRIQLYDPNGVRIAEAVDESYPYTYVAIEDYQLEMAGTYTIIASYDGGMSEYGLSLVLTGGTTTSVQDHDGGDLTPSGARAGTITPYGDTDIYIIYGQVGQGIVIQMADDDAAWSPRMQLYDPKGDLIVEAVDGSYPYTYSAIEDYRLEMTGIYTIVASYDGGTGEYGLSVSVIPPIDPYGRYPYDLAPPDGNSIDLCDCDTLSWCPVNDATGYDVYFSDSPCMPLEMVAENIQDPYVPMPAIEGGQNCSWRVDAHTPDGDIQGPTWWFVTEPFDCSLLLSSIGQGSIIDPNEGFYEYTCGDVESVTAVADPDFEFVRWEGTAVDANKVIIEYEDPTGSQVSVTVDGVYTLTAVFEEVLFDFPLDSDPEWIMEGQWEFGVPTGQGGEEYGNPDPASGYTGSNVLGVNLNGDYEVKVGPLYSLLAGPFDLSGYSDVNLRFARWLNTDEPRYVKISVDVSIDSENWFALWESKNEITDSQWVPVIYFLGAEADGQSAIYLRWTYQVVNERAYPYSGWNLDDIQLCGKRQ